MVQKHPKGGYPLTTDIMWRINSILESKGLTWRYLGISKRTWLDWVAKANRRLADESCEYRMRPSSIKLIANRLGMTVDELTSSPVLDFSHVSSAAHKINSYVMGLTRKLQQASAAELEHAYRDHLISRLGRDNTSVKSFMDILRQPKQIAKLIETLPNPDLSILIDDHFAQLSYQLPNGRAINISKPQLLWDCHCNTPKAKLGAEHCPIHASHCGTEVTQAMNAGLVEIEWRGLKFLWRRAESLWPPSVDTVWMLLNLEREGVFTRRFKSVIDIGAGTGFLGTCLARLMQTISEVTLTDWLLTPLLFSAINWYRNRELLNGASIRYEVGMGNKWLGDGALHSSSSNLVVCNPPYLPILRGFEELGAHSLVAGTDLLTEVIKNKQDLHGETYVQFSHLAMPEAREAARIAGSKLVPIGQKSRRVPFRVRRAWERLAYLDVLVDQRGLIFNPKLRLTPSRSSYQSI